MQWLIALHNGENGGIHQLNYNIPIMQVTLPYQQPHASWGFQNLTQT
jgi:hypothetical protein